MATDLATSARVTFTWSYTNTLDVGNTVSSNTAAFTKSLSNGTAADTADILYVNAHTIGASASLDLDLAASLVNPFGTTLTFARVKCVFITWQSDNTASEISVGGDGAAAAPLWFAAGNDEEKVHSTGCLFHFRSDATAWPVTATTADILEITNLDATNSAKIFVHIVGCSV